MDHEKSLQFTKEFDEYYPIRHSNFRCRIAATDYKLFVDKAEGSRIWDVDGNEYVDYLNAFEPTMLGNRHQEYVNALKG
jgi:glutamate-1-semialdehyde 2,1-aminomutase